MVAGGDTVSIGKRIKSAREKKDMTLDEVARLCNTTKQTIFKYENEIVTNIPYDKIVLLAKALGVSPSYLFEWEEPKTAIPNHSLFSPMPRMKEWKVLGGTACGDPLHMELEETITAPADIDADYVFRCVGDSMIGARILDGDIVFVKSGNVESGQIGVVRVEDSYSLKRIYHGEDYLELRSENPKHPPIILRGEQINAEIIGRAICFQSRVI
jgi:repressor LexA